MRKSDYALLEFFPLACQVLLDTCEIATTNCNEGFGHQISQSGCGQYSNAAFHVAVVDILLYLSGDVEKNPGPVKLCEFCGFRYIIS